MNTRNAPSHRWSAFFALAAVLTFLGFHAAIPAYGQATPNPPGQMTFQGFLTDAGTPPVPLGNSSPENKTVVFKIYRSFQSTDPADVLWAEQQIVTIDKGYFSVILGEGSEVSGLAHDADLSSVFTGQDASDRWIGITVDGGEIVPRNRFFPSPYAQLARRARTADLATSANALVNSGGTTPVVTTQAGRMEVAGELVVNSGSLSVTGNASVSGSATLGNTTVNSQLTVTGNASVNGTLTAGLITTGTSVITSGGNSTPLNIQSAASDARIFAGGASPRILINPGGGNVGIGTFDPTKELEIKGSAGSRFQFSSEGGHYFVLQARHADGANFAATVLRSDDFVVETGTAGTAVTERFRITDAGNVGIGTTTPQNTLDVNGGISVSGSISSPKWRITNVLDGAPTEAIQTDGVLLATSASFASGGGTLSIQVSVTGYSGGVGMHQVEVLLDDVSIGFTQMFFNQAVHLAFPTKTFIIKPEAGNHVIKLRNTHSQNVTVYGFHYDHIFGIWMATNDRYQVIVTEYPF